MQMTYQEKEVTAHEIPKLRYSLVANTIDKEGA